MKDYTGITSCYLTFVRPTDRRSSNKGIIWELLCKCGKIHYCRPQDVLCGRITSCGCNTSNRMSIAGKQSRQFPPHISSARVVWRTYRSDGLDFESFYALSQQPCYYCGRKPHRTINISKSKSRSGKCSDEQIHNGDFTYNGLDRVDNTKGHVKENIVPCCCTCNKSKMDQTLEDFLLHIERMYEHTRKLRQIQMVSI